MSSDKRRHQRFPVRVKVRFHSAIEFVTEYADNLSAGIASAAFIAYLSGLTNIEYSATQYALFSSVMLLLPKFVAGFSGVFVDAHGYAAFFHATAALGVPVLLLIWLAGRVVPATTAAPAERTERSR